MNGPDVFHLPSVPAHLGLGATVAAQEPFDGTFAWYERYVARTTDDGVDGRLVSMVSFEASWTSWEMHPHGDELVVCTAGTLTLRQEVDGGVQTVVLQAGDAVINPPGVWHTADVDAPCTALFVTAGVGTEHRPR